ncbi:MAG: FHA domain-containing protein [Myxococcales bacterium]|jgi:hypothetical protein
MTTQDQNKKTLRHFQCRDYLWEIFEQMSAELECSTDYLINEAMRQYARSRNYGTGRASAQGTPQPQVPAQQPAPAAPPGGIPSLRAGAPARPSMPAPPPRPSMPATNPAPRRPSSMPPPPPRPAPSMQQPSMPARPAVSAPPPPPPQASMPPQAAQQMARPQLYIIFNGQKIPVTKDEFIIGRGSKSADLAIKDGNISRRHAAVVWHNGAHYLKDLGSTNGVEFQGRRFDSKRIEEGDLFRLCDYELQFTYT